MPTGMKNNLKIPSKIFTNLSFWKKQHFKDLVQQFFDFLCKAKYFKRTDPQDEIVSCNC
jgi:hypothetical protein